MATAAAENEQELRLALAMRGGASMAVWIGGAVAEINRLREAVADSRAPADDDSTGTHPWASLAKLSGYDAVAVDVLAGASAGGLNATLLSATLVYGMPFDRMREVWVRLGDVEAMSRPVPKFWQHRPPSLLEGDRYFRAELADVITDNVPAAAEHPGHRADLLLTATLLDPILERRFDGRSGPMLQERRTASFRFRHQGRAGDPLSDFGAGDDFAPTVLRLAHAARSTSSFPFAFEPAQVRSSLGEPPDGEPNMIGLFSETASDPLLPPFRVIDGGVLDNIPVTAAIDAISAAPANRPTHRWLLYLNPDPVASREQRREPGFAVPVTATALRARLSQESLLADLDALDEHNRLVARTALRRKALYAPLRAAPDAERAAVLAQQVDAVLPDHAVVRAELDAQAVYRLLTEPAGIEDGKLLPPVVGDPLAEWSAQARTQLAHRLSAGLGSDATTRVFDDARGLLTAVQECLGWAWDIERWAPESREIGRCKSVLYRLRSFGEVLEGHADQYWINGAKLEPIVETTELDEWVQRVQRRRARLQHALPSPIQPLLGEVLRAIEAGEDFHDDLAEFARELMSIVESSGADAVPDADGVDAVAEAHAMLHRVADRLAAAAPPRERIDEPQQLGYALLERSEQRAATLRQLVVLTAPLDVGRVPGSRINLLRVVSDEQSPLPFDALRRGEDVPLRIADKIRGLDVGNFGAFLSAKWRANDWMWGRMDSAAALVRLLADPARLARRHSSSEELGDALQAIVSRPTTAELGELGEEQAKQWRGFLAEVWARHAGEVRAELDALFAAPDDEHSLTETQRLLTERLQWTIAAEEIPFVHTVSSGADPESGAEPPVPAPAQLSGQVERYDVGRQRFADLGEPRALSMATRFGLLAYRAVRPSGRGVLPWLGRRAMTLIKPLLMAVVYAIAAPRRAALLGFLAASAVVFTGVGWGSMPGTQVLSADQHESAFDSSFVVSDGPFPPGSAESPLLALSVACSDSGTGVDVGCADGFGWFGGVPGNWLVVADFSGTSFGPGALLAMLFTAVFAVWSGWRLAHRVGRGLARWLPAVFIAVVLLAAEFWLFTTGFRLGPLGLALVAGLLTWPAAVAYRTAARVGASVLTLLVFVGVLWSYEPNAFSGGGWIVLATGLTAYAHMILVGTVDVLAPRPRRRAGFAQKAPSRAKAPRAEVSDPA
ncbi:patatin-like protein [Saccharopolyspora elongata]|uniref:Patatin-like protein n=1 Tax=Saccharopolyspora elongata TaxID=2530387 RepID=A0A4R4Z6E0_9PSEU|nr:patatin-like protein [Saccharopolyspora elongata]TDD53663.1 patatin-like protein [Saccharopolyspora elongata]